MAWSVLAGMSSRVLAEDVWQAILGYLDQSHIHYLRCSGDPWLLGVVGRHKTAFFYRENCLTLSWPSRVHSESLITDLSVIIVSLQRPNVPFTPLTLACLPKTLTKLTVETVLPMDLALLFSVASSFDARSKLSTLDAHLPSLHTLRLYAAEGMSAPGGIHFWMLPSSLTSFSGFSRRIVFHSEIPLPPNITHIHVPEHSIHPSSFTPSMAQNMQTLISQSSFNSALPPMANLTTLRDTDMKLSDSWGKFPSLTALYCTVSSAALDCPSFRHLKLKLLVVKYEIRPEQYALLPRSLTKVRIIKNIGVLLGFDRNYVHDLPPNLIELKLAPSPHTDKQLLPLLSKNLQTLDIGDTALPRNDSFAMLPSTLTCLRTHNLNEGNVRHIRHLKLLTDLSLFGGRMTAAFARNLPRSLTRLRLWNVSLRINGSNHTKGWPTRSAYSMDRPETTALIDTLPPLTTLIVTALYGHSYWWTHARAIFARLPISLTKLMLDSGSQNIQLFSPEQDSAQVVNAINRLTNLRMLVIRTWHGCSPPGMLEQSLPRELVAFSGPAMSREHVKYLPKSLRYISLTTNNHHDAIAEHLGVPAQYLHVTHHLDTPRNDFDYNQLDRRGLDW